MRQTIRRVTNAVCALAVSCLLLFVLDFGYGPVPALGRALGPGAGVWTASAAASTRAQTLRLPGLREPASVSFTPMGYASVAGADSDDLFLAQGYVTARLRFTEMDLERRTGEGLLSQLQGPSKVPSDEFELQLGLERTAAAEWAATAPGSAAGRALTAYARGVNDYLAQLRASGRWPAIYALTGVYPTSWTPVDSLVTQELLTQELDFSTTPLDYELLEHSLGAQRAMAWFPVDAPTGTARQPYDPGPYQDLPPAPFATANANAAASAPTGPATSAAVPAPSAATAGAVSAAAILSRVSGLSGSERNVNFDSNAWAANGPDVTGGGAMLAGDPHLQLTLPSTWFEVSLTAPGLEASGGSLPGMPAIVLGHNGHISWSITNTENQSVMYYDERTSAAHPGAYYWDGAWRRMRQVRYSIPVRGAAAVSLTAELTVHGPVMTMEGQTVSVTWMGDYPSGDLAALLAVDQASDFAGFRAALRGWHAPTVNFVYADDRGNIGAVSPGYYPQTPHGSRPWLPLPGTGTDDITGTIAPRATPVSYNPPGHLIVSTNQRPVADDYPYYIGTSLDFDPGYRGSVITADVAGHSPVTMADFAALQHNVTDGLAAVLVPALLNALNGDALTGVHRAARDELASWNDSMDTSSAAAAVWWTFLSTYLTDVFGPWWSARKVPVQQDPSTLALSTLPISLREALQQWTLNDPGNSAFTPPGGTRRTATDVMRSAFSQAVDDLTAQLGPDPATWTWGRLHSWEIPSITGASGLGYGPIPAGGDPWTVDAADGGMVSSFGPSWRMIINWTAWGRATALAIYPGGQDEDPASGWYQNLIPLWNNDQYLPLHAARVPSPGTFAWTLRPGT